ncbi:Uncharacterized protein FKW44_003199 [Caligus rogercresseyi]|uniref:Uncharacterized protein n=1 Tax=Caligus rogercresseyi TaxID=217165 RepID=A0A7T8KLA5_CALRO|nr:Uncharacterized protein FKW44_003199 [Caligus rogercresseyi]
MACVNEDLRCHSYKLKVGELLTQKKAPSSPDLNPMDYFFWGYLERHTNQRRRRMD